MATPTLTPVYTDVSAEYQAITEGRRPARQFLHRPAEGHRRRCPGPAEPALSTNGIINLAPGQGAPTILTTDRGRILDLLGVINTGDYTLLITSPGCQQTVIDWLDKYTIMEDLEVEDISDLNGPSSPSAGLPAGEALAGGRCNRSRTAAISRLWGHIPSWRAPSRATKRWSSAGPWAI